MKVILSEEVDNLGNAGDLVAVKPGYARNYLFPRGLAVRADERNLRQLEHNRRVMEARRRRLEDAAKAAAKQVDKVGRVVVVRACGSEGKLFGSVTSMDIVAALKEREVEVDRRQIKLSEPLRALGDYDVPVKLGQGIAVSVKVSVEPDEASASLIAKAAAAAAASSDVGSAEA
ncbi:MAG: 50S ribosomal protein L9 [Deltaproteobacteria bacterium]|nr:50S ribosomal protein L9 [Deltaproteobacteria bacterium]